MRLHLLVIILSSAALVACKKPQPASSDQSEPAVGGAPAGQTATAAGGADAKAKAHEIFATRCTPCHGPEGRGDGPASSGLTPKPRNFHDHEWHHTVDDAYIEKIIKFGGAAVGRSPAMPSNPDLNDQGPVVAELRTIVRGFNAN